MVTLRFVSGVEAVANLAETNLEKARAEDDDDDDSSDDDPPGLGAIQEVTADKGYHKASTIHPLEKKRTRTCIPERAQRGRRRWKKKGGREVAKSVYRNRARVKSQGESATRKRGELIERTFAHFCETGA